MGIWIRSQNESVLANIVSITADKENNVIGYDSCSHDANEYYVLGKYSSKEKAIKVLDMIQIQIEKGTRIVTHYKPALKQSDWYEVEHHEKVVFQMPQDSEVEV